MGGEFLPLASHLNPHLSLITPYSIISILSYGTLSITPYLNHALTPACPSLINIRFYVFLFLQDQYFSLLSLKWQGPLKVILVTPTAANLKGRSLRFHLSHFKLLPLHLKMILFHTEQLQQDPARLSFWRHWDQLPCHQFRKNEVSPHNCTLLDWEPHMHSFSMALPSHRLIHVLLFLWITPLLLQIPPDASGALRFICVEMGKLNWWSGEGYLRCIARKETCSRLLFLAMLLFVT